MTRDDSPTPAAGDDLPPRPRPAGAQLGEGETRQPPRPARGAWGIGDDSASLPSRQRAREQLAIERLGTSGGSLGGEALSEIALSGRLGEASNAPAESRSPKGRSGLLEVLVLVLLALVLALSLKTYVAEAYEIKGRSMAPTFHNGERVVVLKVLYGIQRGDVIIFSSVKEPQKDLIKRVVGLPGERIRIRDGKVFVDGEFFEETYLEAAEDITDGFQIDELLGPNEYFVLGDNRRDSHDSRMFGPVPGTCLKGKVVVRWWPFHELQAF